MPEHDPQRTVQLLQRISAGEPGAMDELMPLVYDELRRTARRLLDDQRRATLQPTELIHEAYVRLVGGEAGAPVAEDRRHFQRLAARAMRYVLVDRARARQADKRGGGVRPKTLDEAISGSASAAEQVLVVHDALEALAKLDPHLAELVQLRFYGGMTMDEVAAAMSISRRTAQRSWQLARAWWIEEYAA